MGYLIFFAQNINKLFHFFDQCVYVTQRYIPGASTNCDADAV